MITITGLRHPKVHLLKSRLVLIGSIIPRLGYPFDSGVRSDALGPGFLGVATLTWWVMISACKSMSRGGEDWGDRRSFEAVQVRRALAPDCTIDGLPPISGQLGKTKRRRKVNAVSTSSPREGDESKAQAWPATYRRQLMAQ